MQSKGFLKPNNLTLLEAKNLLDAAQAGAALEKLIKYHPQNELDEQWMNLITGLCLQDEDKMDESLNALTRVVNIVRSSASPTSEQFRVAGYALKKIGFYYRQKSDFDKAFGEHSIELEYFKHHGSADEIHDALISLDNDAYGMKDFSLDIMLISESIKVASSIVDKKSKLLAQGMSWNNYAQTLPLLHRFSEADDAAKKSIVFYTEYEALAGTSANYLVWAYAGRGSVLQLWMNQLAASDRQNAEQKHQKLVHSYNYALSLAMKCGIKGNELSQLQAKVKCLSGSLDEALRCSSN